MKKIGGFLFLLSVIISCQTSPKNGSAPEIRKVEISEKDGVFGLLVDGEPFYINGAGLEFGDIASLSSHNANSFRTWRTDNGERSGKEVLDEAYENGVLVTMGIEVARERHGFDYDDELAVQKQLEDIKSQVLELKDHPALFIWAIGNELNLHYENPKVWNAVNEISEMIHNIDPNHLTTTTLAGISKKEIDFIKERASDLDLLSIQMYGDLPNLPKLVREFGWTGPYMVTEWGATGHWEVPQTAWGAPIEENSTLKAANYLKRYKKGIEVDSLQCVGSYVFLWGNKQERTPTWYGIFLDNGMETESVDVMHYIWNGSWPDNRTPQINSFTINNKTAYESITMNRDEEIRAELAVFDPEGDELEFTYEILYESKDLQDGGDYEEKPEAIKLDIVSKEDGNIVLKTPEAAGEYRLFVYVTDGANHAATANIPFKIE